MGSKLASKSVRLYIDSDVSGVRRGIGQVNREISGLQRSSRLASRGIAVAAAAAAAGGFAIGKGLIGALQAAGDFEQKLDVLRETSNSSAAQMKLLSDAAIRLGKDSKLPATTAKSAAEAMLELAKGGMGARKVLGSVRSVLLLSTAAQIDNVKSAKAVVSALKTFKLPASQAARVVDNFAGAANASIADMEDITDAMAIAGVGFKALKIPIGDATTAIAIMADAGQKGGMAGAALNVALTRLAAPTDKAKALMKDLGIQVFDADGNFVGVRAAIENMTPILGKMSDKQRLATLSTLAGTRGMRALDIVLGAGTKSWDEYHKNVTKTGQAQGLADAQTRGFRGAMLAFRSSLETLQLEIGQKLLPVATRFLRWLNAELPTAIAFAKRVIHDLTPAFNSVKDAVQQTVAYIREHWKEISLIFKGVKDSIVGTLRLTGDIIHGRWAKIWADTNKNQLKNNDVFVGLVRLLGQEILREMQGSVAAAALQGAIRVARQIGTGIKRAPGYLAGLAGDLAARIGAALRQAASDAYAWAVQVGQRIAQGVLAGLAGLPGKILAAVTPSVGGGKGSVPGSGTGRGSRTGKSGGGMIPGRYSAGDRVPAMLAGGEAVLNPTQIGMVNAGMTVTDALRMTGAPVGLATGGSVRGGAATSVGRSSGGRSQAGTVGGIAGRVAKALANRTGAWDLAEAQGQLAIARADGNAGASVNAYIADLDREAGKKKMIEAILANPAKALGVKGAKLSRDQRTQLIQSLASVLDEMRSDKETIHDLLHPSQADGTAGDSGSGADAATAVDTGPTQDQLAIIAQKDTIIANLTRGSALSAAALSGFGSSGDIGTGNFRNAFDAAKGGPQLAILGDARSLMAIAGGATAGMGLQPSINSNTGSIRV